MIELLHKLTNDILFKMIFVQNPDLLIRLVALLLGVRLEDIKDLEVKNPEIKPDKLGDKFCKLDINMLVDGKLVDLEIQVEDEHDYPERSVYYWTRIFSGALPERGDYRGLPQTIVISIVAFPLFRCEEYYSEFRLLEVRRHEQLTDKMCMLYFELPKVPDIENADSELMYWLLLFKAKTEEELTKIEEKGGPVMAQVIEAYRHIVASEEFKENERMRVRREQDEASALSYAQWEKAIAIAKKMKDSGAEISYIIEMTDLTVDDILRL